MRPWLVNKGYMHIDPCHRKWPRGAATNECVFFEATWFVQVSKMWPTWPLASSRRDDLSLAESKSLSVGRKRIYQVKSAKRRPDDGCFSLSVKWVWQCLWKLLTTPGTSRGLRGFLVRRASVVYQRDHADPRSLFSSANHRLDDHPRRAEGGRSMNETQQRE